jgi:hypothetical protein
VHVAPALDAIDALFHRYQNVYGQNGDAAARTGTRRSERFTRLRGSPV